MGRRQIPEGKYSVQVLRRDDRRETRGKLVVAEKRRGIHLVGDIEISFAAQSRWTPIGRTSAILALQRHSYEIRTHFRETNRKSGVKTELPPAGRPEKTGFFKKRHPLRTTAPGKVEKKEPRRGRRNPESRQSLQCQTRCRRAVVAKHERRIGGEGRKKRSGVELNSGTLQRKKRVRVLREKRVDLLSPTGANRVGAR